MLVREQVAGEVREFVEVQHAEFAAVGDGAHPAQGRPEVLLGVERERGFGFEETWRERRPRRPGPPPIRTPSCVTRSASSGVPIHYPLVSDHVADGRPRHRFTMCEHARDQTLAPPRAGERAIDVHAAVAPGLRESAQVANDCPHAVGPHLKLAVVQRLVRLVVPVRCSPFATRSRGAARIGCSRPESAPPRRSSAREAPR